MHVCLYNSELISLNYISYFNVFNDTPITSILYSQKNTFECCNVFKDTLIISLLYSQKNTFELRGNHLRGLQPKFGGLWPLKMRGKTNKHTLRKYVLV